MNLSSASFQYHLRRLVLSCDMMWHVCAKYDIQMLRYEDGYKIT